MPRHLFAAVSILLCLALAACAPRGQRPAPEIVHPDIPADLVLVRSISAQTAESAHMESASLNISDPKNLAGKFEERLERMLVDRQFTLTDQPSLAERIISLKILYKGEAGREDMERAVKAGYNTPMPELSGEGGVLVADLLLVRRRIPSSANMELSTISARNTMSSSTLRIGLYSSAPSSLKDRSLEEALARDIARLAASDEDAEVHKTSSLTLKKKKPAKKRKKPARKSSRKKSSRR